MAECKLREWCLDDAHDMVKAINNKNVQDNLRDGLPFPYTQEDACDFIKMVLASEKDKSFVFAITVGDRAVGSIGAERMGNIHNRTAEIGYYISEEYWGQGIGTAAVKQICSYVFETTDIVRLFAEPYAYNAASRRILEKAGFSCEGVLKKNAYKNGKILDMVMYALVKEE